MKDVGYTPEGNRLVEMNREEYRQFIFLHEAIEGHGFPEFSSVIDYGFRESFDFTKTFGVIYAYYRNRFQINQHQQLLDDIKSALEKES